MSRFLATKWGLFVPLGSLVFGCGSSSDSSLYGGTPGRPLPGVGAGGSTSPPSAGGAPLTSGSSGGVSDLGIGGEAAGGSGGVSSPDSGVVSGRGGGGGGLGGNAASGGESGGGAGGEPGGPWARCNTDGDCVGGRVCTKSAQSILVSGRSGGCVHHCGLTTAQCDPPPAVGAVTCTQLVVASFCTITCASGNLCPPSMDCVGGICYYSK